MEEHTRTHVEPIRVVSVIHGSLDRKFTKGELRAKLCEAERIHIIATKMKESYSEKSRQVMFVMPNTSVIAFNNFDMIQFPHDDPLVISSKVANCIVKSVLADTGSSVKVLFTHAFDQMGLSREDINPMSTSLVGFDGTSMVPVGTIGLNVTAT